MWRGETGPARERFEAFRSSAAERGEPNPYALARLHLCELELRVGRWDAAGELLDEWAPDNAANERLFRLGASVAESLCAGGAVDALARYFEYWLLRLEGVYPALDVCPRCGQANLHRGAVLVLAERMYVCADCGHGGPPVSAASDCSRDGGRPPAAPRWGRLQESAGARGDSGKRVEDVTYAADRRS